MSVIRGASSTPEVVKQVQQALAEQDDKLATFAKLLIKAATDEKDDAEKKDKKDAAVKVTETQCKSG